MKKYITILLLAFLAWNCSEDTLPLYSGESSVYFTEQEVNFAFGPFAVMDSVIRIPVTATGPIVDHDRYFRVVYDSVSGEEGIHYDPLPTEGVFPAGASRGNIPIRLHRVENDNAIYKIYLRLVPSDDFTLNLPEKYSSGDTIDITRASLSYSSAFTKPVGWMDMLYGYFSAAKYVIACEVTGRDATFWNARPSGQTPMALAAVIGTYINSRILAGRDQALRDPGNPNAQDKGFMTMRGANAAYAQTIPIPADWAPGNE